MDDLQAFPASWAYFRPLQSLVYPGGGRVVLGKLPAPGRPTILITVGQGAGGGCLDIFTLIYPFSPLSPSLGDGPI